jgi:hypothetical protein
MLKACFFYQARDIFRIFVWTSIIVIHGNILIYIFPFPWKKYQNKRALIISYFYVGSVVHEMIPS